MTRCLRGVRAKAALIAVVSGLVMATTTLAESKGERPVVILSTSQGDITIELYSEKAPESVRNFLAYVDKGFFDGTIFHRVILDFMIQGGGFTSEMKEKPTQPPIKNEADNGLKNEAGTLAMARTAVKDSATSQFFINLKSNDFLNHGSHDFGYAVFGKVIAGMNVINKIAQTKTTTRGGHADVPIESMVIQTAKRKSAPVK